MATAACAPPLGATERVPRKGKENHFFPYPNRGRVQVNKSARESARLGAEGIHRVRPQEFVGAADRSEFSPPIPSPATVSASAEGECSELPLLLLYPFCFHAVGAGTGDPRWPAGQLAAPAGRERAGRKNVGTGPSSLLYFPLFQLLGETNQVIFVLEV
jgi:hypothetical protein